MADLRRRMNAGKLARLEVKMFKNFSLALLLSASLGFAQVVTMGGTATTAGPAVATVPMSAANAPLVSTPDISLPGSGPAMGAPIASAAANDSRSSGGPSVYNPNAMPVPEPAPANLAAVPNAASLTPTPQSSTTGTAGTTASATTTEPFENGIQHFESGLPNPSNPTPSLGQIARAYRAQHRQAAKTFNNQSIAELNVRGVRTGNLGPEESTVAANSRPAAEPAQAANQGTLMAQNQPPTLPQSDQYQPAASSAPPNPTAFQQRHKAAEQPAASASQSANASQEQGSSSQTASATNESNNKQNAAALPQTGSPLPLLLLLGGLGVVGGVVYWLRR